MPKTLTTDKLHDALAMYEAGASCNAVGKEFSLAPSTVMKYAKLAGIVGHQGRGKLPDDVCDGVADLYASGASCAEVGRVFNVSQGTVGRIARRAGVGRSVGEGHLLRWKLSADKQRRIADLHCEGVSTAEIMRRADVGRYAVKQVLKQRGEAPRESGSYSRRYSVDLDFFREIDTEEKAYTLGFIAADGCVHGNTLIICIQRNDEAVIRAMRAAMQSEHPVRQIAPRHTKKNTGPQSDFRVCARELVRDLQRHKITERKSLTLEFPDTVPNHLIRHFVRGWFDGDGCVAAYPERGKFTFMGVGSGLFLARLREVVLENTGVDTLVRKAKNKNLSLWSARGGIHGAAAFTRWLYDDATIYLERKYQKHLIGQEIAARTKVYRSQYGRVDKEAAGHSRPVVRQAKEKEVAT
jgi:hypothetical protein